MLYSHGYDLVATDLVPVTATPYPFVPADLLNHKVVGRLLEGIEAVCHLGNHPGVGRRPPQEVFNENVSMNQNVFQAAAEAGVERIVFSSTLQVIGSHIDRRTVVNPSSPPTLPMSGMTVPQPANAYALSKAVTEQMLRYYADRCGIGCIAVRFPMLHNHDRWIKVDSGQETEVDIFEAFTGLTYGDAANLVLAILQSDLPGYRVYMPAITHRHSRLGIADLVGRFYPLADSGLCDLVDLSRIVAETGWEPGDSYGHPRQPHHPQQQHNQPEQRDQDR